MPSREEHMASDVKLGLEPQPEVHQLLDQFAHYPNMWFLSRHRKYLHHAEGIEYVTKLHGEEAGKSAHQHVLDDCGHIPKMSDYHTGRVDQHGYVIERLRRGVPG